jgi:hypothetical protein
MAIDESVLAELATYARDREDSLHACNANFEGQLEGLVQSIINPDGTAAERITDDMREQLNRIDSVRGTFRGVLYVGVCTFLNEMVAAFAKQAVSDYGSKPKNGSEIAADLDLLRSDCGVDVGAYAQEAEDHNLVRNCLVHTWGIVEEFRNSVRLRDAIGRLKCGDEQVWMVKDGYLVDDGAVCLALSTYLELRYILVRHFESKLC